MDMGYEVFDAEDGGIGLDKAMSQHPDIILLDMMMPVMDGLQLLGKLKASPSTQGIPVIMVSAKGQGEDVMKALNAGATGYAVKPWEEAALESALAGAEKHIR
ncbi:MAG: hypothetical protein BZY88_16630 [SAR202 cluster bacterium Io17-Chloro-G9]|nr:MAG: hypothetical protein BZY88_16630 [SAR202 cluster bacterium Io17-Chloro-G9]